MAVKFVAISGSTREGSWNSKLIRVAAAAARAAGAEVELLDLRALALPLFDEDLEKRGTPEGVGRLKGALIPADGLIFSSPEYNSSFSAVLKNAIDWASRPAKGEAPLAAFSGKVAGLFAASTGALGGLRGLVHLRSVLGNIGVVVLPDQLALPRAHEAFSPDGALIDEAMRKRIASIAERAVEVAGRLKR